MVRKKSRPSTTQKLKKIQNASQRKGKTAQPTASTTSASPIKKRKAGTIGVLVQHNPVVQTFNRNMYKEIRHLQRSTGHLIPRLPFQRIVREIMMEFCPSEQLRIQTEALQALQEAVEMYTTQYFEDAYFCCLHAKRKTLNVADMQCVRRLRGRSDIINH